MYTSGALKRIGSNAKVMYTSGALKIGSNAKVMYPNGALKRLGRQLPPTLDMINLLVQEAVMHNLCLNGSRKAGVNNKWGIRKIRRKITWTTLWCKSSVSYDDDELAVI
jgi:hypothetical protein